MREDRRTIPFYEIRLDDLRAWHVVEGECANCGHQAAIPHQALRRRHTDHEFLKQLERKLRCSRCGLAGQNVLKVSMLPR